jgi:ribonuclease D
MLALPTKDPVWIATPLKLQEMVEELSHEPVVAVDTESNSLYAYRERVCLVQISTPQTDYLVDPLAIDDLSPLALLFADPMRQKIFHAAEYDVICLKRDYSFEFSNIFDTMIAARILAEPQVGLGSLLQNYFSIKLDKRFQRADWGKRPLSQAMLDYARMDTHFLFALKTLLEEKLGDKGLLSLAREDFDLVSATIPSGTEPNGKSCWKVSGAAHLSPRENAILQSLCAYRDQYARKVNLPHFKVISNELLVEITRANPATLDELKAVPGMSAKVFQRHSTGLLQAVTTGKTASPPKRERMHRPDQGVLNRLNALHDWRKEQGKRLQVESDVVLPREFMEKIATANPGNLTELHVLMQKVPWRFERYGNAILAAITRKETHENII